MYKNLVLLQTKLHFFFPFILVLKNFLQDSRIQLDPEMIAVFPIKWIKLAYSWSHFQWQEDVKLPLFSKREKFKAFRLALLIQLISQVGN